MKLSGDELQQICDALLAAYPTADALHMMVRIGLNEELAVIAGGENLRSVVFNLVTWAERQRRIDELVAAAYRQTPSNEALQQLMAARRIPRAPAAVHGAASATAPAAAPPAAPPLSPAEAARLLREVLSTLFDDDASAAIVARDAGLDTRRIRYDGVIYNYWDAILNEAQKQDLTESLVQIALQRYPRNTDLRCLAQQYHVA